MIEVRHSKVTYHRYRTKRPANVFIAAMVTKDDDWCLLREELHYLTETTPDNHETFVIERGKDSITVMFSDFSVYVGIGLVDFE